MSDPQQPPSPRLSPRPTSGAEFGLMSPRRGNAQMVNTVQSEDNPLATTAEVDNFVIRVENLSDAKVITKDQLKELIETLQSFDTNEGILYELDDLKTPYLFSSDSLIKILDVTTSIRTKITIIAMLGPRLTDPKSKPSAFTDMFRFSEEKARVEEILKNRASTIAAATFKQTAPVATGGRGGGRGGAGRGGAGRGSGVGSISRTQSKADVSDTMSETSETDSRASLTQRPRSLSGAFGDIPIVEESEIPDEEAKTELLRTGIAATTSTSTTGESEKTANGVLSLLSRPSRGITFNEKPKSTLVLPVAPTTTGAKPPRPETKNGHHANNNTSSKANSNASSPTRSLTSTPNGSFKKNMFDNNNGTSSKSNPQSPVVSRRPSGVVGSRSDNNLSSLDNNNNNNNRSVHSNGSNSKYSNGNHNNNINQVISTLDNHSNSNSSKTMVPSLLVNPSSQGVDSPLLNGGASPMPTNFKTTTTTEELNGNHRVGTDSPLMATTTTTTTNGESHVTRVEETIGAPPLVVPVIALDNNNNNNNLHNSNNSNQNGSSRSYSSSPLRGTTTTATTTKSGPNDHSPTPELRPSRYSSDNNNNSSKTTVEIIGSSMGVNNLKKAFLTKSVQSERDNIAMFSGSGSSPRRTSFHSIAPNIDVPATKTNESKLVENVIRAANAVNLTTTEFLHLQPEEPIGVHEGKGHVLFSYRELVRQNHFKDYRQATPGELEKHLTNTEFQLRFGMTFETFESQPKWRKISQKKNLYLF